MTRTIVWFMLSDEQQDQFFERFIRGDKLDMAEILPISNRAVDTKSWCRKHWGSTNQCVPIKIEPTCFIIETDFCPGSDWFMALGEAMFDTELIVISAGNTMGFDVVGFYVKPEGLVPRTVRNPVRLACVVWTVDYADYLSKKKNMKESETLKAEEILPSQSWDDDDILLCLEDENLLEEDYEDVNMC